jgi:death-on-curing protein
VTAEPFWISAVLAVAIHDRLIKVHGGGSGIRDKGLLESALSSPLNRYQYGERELVNLAANYAHSINRNHPFIDGNKRVAFLLAATFLELNGLRVEASESEVVEKTLALAAREISEQEFADWLRKNAR